MEAIHVADTDNEEGMATGITMATTSNGRELAKPLNRRRVWGGSYKPPGESFISENERAIEPTESGL